MVGNLGFRLIQLLGLIGFPVINLSKCFGLLWFWDLAGGSLTFVRHSQILKPSTSLSIDFSTYIILQGSNCKIPLRWMAFYFICRAMIDRIKPIIGKMINPLILSSNFMTNLPLACISDPTKRPVPLQLDVAIPSFQDLKWSFSRLYYLFNVQLERNIGM